MFPVTIRQRWRNAFVALALAAATTACSSTKPPTLEQACSNYAAVMRERETTCYGVTPEPNVAAITERSVRSCVLTSGAPGSNTGEAYWETCAATANNGCAGFRCSAPPTGARIVGAPCLTALQCVSLFCKGTNLAVDGGTGFSDAVQCGQCAPRLPAGAACDVATDGCDLGLSCFDGTCRVQGVAGEACATTSDCVGGSFVCKAGGVCGAITRDGQPCQTSSDCTTDSACDLVAKVCAPTQYGAPGAACDSAVHSCAAGSCNVAAGVCPSILPDGTACTPGDPATVCDVYARCFGGTCSIPDPLACH